MGWVKNDGNYDSWVVIVGLVKNDGDYDSWVVMWGG